MGVGLVGRVLGSVGIGNIGAEMFRLAKPLDMRYIAHDPYASAEVAKELGVELVDLETVFRISDIVTLNCPLTAETRHIVNARTLRLMKPSAYTDRHRTRSGGRSGRSDRRTRKGSDRRGRAGCLRH